MKRKKNKRAKQLTIPEADTHLSKAVDSFIENKVEMAELKVEKQEIEDKILIEMKKEGRDLMSIPHDGETYIFEIVKGEDKLRCAKTSKTAESGTELDLGEKG
jgi:hypothetical protein